MNDVLNIDGSASRSDLARHGRLFGAVKCWFASMLMYRAEWESRPRIDAFSTILPRRASRAEIEHSCIYRYFEETEAKSEWPPLIVKMQTAYAKAFGGQPGEDASKAIRGLGALVAAEFRLANLNLTTRENSLAVDRIVGVVEDQGRQLKALQQQFMQCGHQSPGGLPARSRTPVSPPALLETGRGEFTWSLLDARRGIQAALSFVSAQVHGRRRPDERADVRDGRPKDLARDRY